MKQYLLPEKIDAKAEERCRRNILNYFVRVPTQHLYDMDNIRTKKRESKALAVRVKG